MRMSEQDKARRAALQKRMDAALTQVNERIDMGVMAYAMGALQEASRLAQWEENDRDRESRFVAALEAIERRLSK